MLTASITVVFEILAPEVVAPFLFCALMLYIQVIIPVLLLAVLCSIPKFAHPFEILLFKQG